MKKLIVSNNPLVYETFNGKYLMVYDEQMSLDDVFVCIRDNIHAGRRLLTHPLSGSVKPHETPYKTVLLTQETGALDTDGLSIIEESIAAANKLKKSVSRKREIPESVLKDYQVVDFNLVEYIITDY